MTHNGDARSYSPKKQPGRAEGMSSSYRRREPINMHEKKKKSKMILSPKPKRFRSFAGDFGVVDFVSFILLMSFRETASGL